MVSWSPAAIPVFLEAYKVFGDKKYLQAAELSADYTFKYGVLAKGMGLCHGTASNIYMLIDVYRATKDPKWRYYITEIFKFSLDTPLLTDPEKFVNYDCIGTYSSFYDTPSSSIAIFADFLTNFDGDLGKMWMLGFGDVPTK